MIITLINSLGWILIGPKSNQLWALFLGAIKINSITKDTFKYNKTDVESYVVKVSWTYSDEQFDSYQKSATLTIIHQDKKLVIVEME